MKTKIEKCCAYCPGKLVRAEDNVGHSCCQPRYVSGNLRISSLKKQSSADCSRKKEVKEERSLSENRSTCYDRFATAKKLHAENLEHQPLPDRVDDSVFKNPRSEGCSCEPSRCCDCCKNKIDDESFKWNLKKSCGAALGCKEPKSKMDLAICWETPVDLTYEPPRPAHIDGSDGGLAPAIFSLVRHNSSSSSSSLTCVHPGATRGKEDSTSCRDRCKAEKKSKSCCGDCLCKRLNGVEISRKSEAEERSKKVSFRNCDSCGTPNTREDPRLIRSAVGLALGTEKPENGGRRRNEGKATGEVTRPKTKTPFARRSFRIDTLTPPFSVVNGCRDTDFPEHWRLMSVYQQSYRNPYRRKIYR